MVVKEPLVTDKQEVLLPNTRQTRKQSPHTNGGTEAGRSSPRGKQQKPPGVEHPASASPHTATKWARPLETGEGTQPPWAPVFPAMKCR